MRRALVLCLWLPLAVISALGTSVAVAAPQAGKPVFLFIAINRSKAELQQVASVASSLGRELLVYPPGDRDPVSRGGLEAFIAHLDSKGRKVVSFGISGHSDGVNFQGEGRYASRWISSDDVTNALAKYPSVRNSVRAIYLHGCYTGTRNAFRRWAEVFPNTVLRTGFDTRAPGWSSAAVQTYVKNVMRKEQELIKASDLAVLKRAYRSITQQTPGLECSLETCAGFWVNSRGETVDSRKRLETCPPRFFRSFYQSEGNPYYKAENGRLFSIFNRYRNLDEEDVPEDEGSSNPIRALYTLLKQYEHCDAEFEEFGVPTPEAVSMVLWNRGVRANFLTYYAAEIAKLRSSGVSAPDLARGNRKLWSDFSYSLSELAEDSSTSAETRKRASRIAAAISSLVIYPNNQCPPFTWHEKQASLAGLEPIPEACLTQ